ncbi:MAG: hypothetical protein ACRD2D_06255 [Terriglobales bacterium]
MTIEEMLRLGQVQTSDNGLVFAVIGENGAADRAQQETVARMAATVPRSLMPRLGRTATYFVPWLLKQRRSIHIGLQAAAEAEKRHELCHHLDVKPGGNLLLISLRFYEHDGYGLAMEFFDKIAYLASLEDDPRPDFGQLLRRERETSKPGELTPEAWEWRQGLEEADASLAAEPLRNYQRAAEADTLGLYMASLYTDVFYEDLFESEPAFPVLDAEQTYERVRTAERLFPPNRGYSLQIIRQRPRRRRAS